MIKFWTKIRNSVKFYCFWSKFQFEWAHTGPKLAENFSEAVIVGSESSTWNKIASEVLSDPSKLDDLGIMPEIQSVASEHDLNVYAAALLYHSTKK